MESSISSDGAPSLSRKGADGVPPAGALGTGGSGAGPPPEASPRVALGAPGEGLLRGGEAVRRAVPPAKSATAPASGNRKGSRAPPCYNSDLPLRSSGG